MNIGTKTIKCTKCGELFIGYANRKICDDCSTPEQLNSRYRYNTNNIAKIKHLEANADYRQSELGKLRKKQRIESQKKPFVYIMYDLNNNPIYVGSTVHLDSRMSYHFHNSKYGEWVKDYELHNVKILDVSKHIKNVFELTYLESLFIKHLNPVKNKAIPTDNGVTKSRKNTIDNLFEQYKGQTKFKIYNTEKWERWYLESICN